MQAPYPQGSDYATGYGYVPVVSNVWVARESDSPDATATPVGGGSLEVPLP